MKRSRIIVVDDHAGVRAGLLGLLQIDGHDVFEASNAADALALLSVIGAIDLLITDVMMPGALNGKQLADRARTLQPSLQVILISAAPRAQLEQEVAVRPNDILLRKPFDAEDLEAVLREILP